MNLAFGIQWAVVAIALLFLPVLMHVLRFIPKTAKAALELWWQFNQKIIRWMERKAS